jgi:hypothetical protein
MAMHDRRRLQSAIMMAIVFLGGSLCGRSGICIAFDRVDWPPTKTTPNHTRQRDKDNYKASLNTISLHVEFIADASQEADQLTSKTRWHEEGVPDESIKDGGEVSDGSVHEAR